MKHAAALTLIAVLAGGCALGPPAPAPDVRKSAQALRAAPPCRTSQLRPRLHLQGATGSLLGGLSLRVVGRSRCSIVGRPRVTFAGAPDSIRWRVSEVPPFYHYSEARSPRALLSLHRGDHIVVDLQWLNWCGPSRNNNVPAPEALVVGLPLRGTGSFRLRLRDTPRCDAPGSPSVLRVGPFVPARY
jgi:Protein of unknown function (DUF4232)